jgi:tetratricopeptide (TPR) repeat protein
MSTGVARQSDSQYETTLEQYAAAMKFFSQQKFDRAKPLFEKVCAGNVRELADRAALHLNSCNGRLAPRQNAAQTPEEYYHHAIVRMNAAQYQEAEELLTKALRAGVQGPHVAYALACLRAQTHDPDAALVHLQEAIRGDAHYRGLARQDRDFAPLMDDPRFTEILYPEGD